MWKPFWDWLATLPPGSASFLGTLTGSSLGLIALLLGALFNAHLNRRRDDVLRAAERLAVASALHAELQGIHRTLVENAQHLIDKPPSPDGGFVVPKLAIMILPQIIAKIGLLEADTIRKVMDAYILSEEYLKDLVLLGGGFDASQNQHTVYLDAKHAQFVSEYNRLKASVVKEALEALARYLK